MVIVVVFFLFVRKIVSEKKSNFISSPISPFSEDSLPIDIAPPPLLSTTLNTSLDFLDEVDTKVATFLEEIQPKAVKSIVKRKSEDYIKQEKKVKNKKKKVVNEMDTIFNFLNGDE